MGREASGLLRGHCAVYLTASSLLMSPSSLPTDET